MASDAFQLRFPALARIDGSILTDWVLHIERNGTPTEEMREFVAAQRRPNFKEAVTASREKRDPDFHNLSE